MESAPPAHLIDMRINLTLPALPSLLLATGMLIGCRPQTQPAPVVPPPASVSQMWTSSSSMNVVSSTGASVNTEAIGEHEVTPETVESLEVPATATGKTMTGRLTVSNTVIYGNAPSTSRDFDTPPTMLEFFDYDCEYCRLYAGTDRAWVDSEYVHGRRMNVERIYLPLTPAGTMMAQAALCAGQQGKFDAMDRFLLTRVPKTQPPVYAVLKDMGINAKTFQTCMDGPPLATEDNGKLADMTAQRIPAFRIGPTFWIGILQRDELKKKIDQALKDTYNR